jgi:hypothetical protein
MRCPLILLLGIGLATAASPPAQAASPVVLDAWCKANGFAIHRDKIHDDSLCVAKAVAYAEGANSPLYIPSGGPILMAGAAQAMLDNITIYANDWEDRGDNSGSYGTQGAVFWITAMSASPFLLGTHSATVSGLNFFWPKQQNAAAEPIAYPALFAPASPSGTNRAFKFRHGTVLNAYDFLAFPTGTIGTVDISDSVIWAIHDAFELSDVPEVFFVHDCLFTMGADGAANTALARWYARHGTWLVVYGNGSSAAKSTRMVSINADNAYVYGASHGIHVLGGEGTAGGIYLGHAIGGGFDAVPSILQIDPNGFMSGFTFSGQYWNAQLYGAPSVQLPHGAVYIHDASRFASTQITFADGYAAAHGDLFDIEGASGLGPIISHLSGYICVGLSGATCHFVAGSANLSVQGNQIAAAGRNNTSEGVVISGFANVANNMFHNMTHSVVINTATGKVVVAANQSAGTTSAHDVIGSYGTNAMFYANAWSKP